MQYPKKLFLLAIITFLLQQVTFAQVNEIERTGYINGTRLSDISAKYIVIQTVKAPGGGSAERVGMNGWWGGQMTNQTPISTESGSRYIFSSVMTAINFMAFNGWELVGKAESYISFPTPVTNGMLFKKREP